MAGHSKWANIRHRKGAQDAKRGKIFTKLIKEITVAVKTGGGPDPDSNPRLRTAIQNAKGQNMPKDNIARAIKKASGAGGEDFKEGTFEGYGPDGVAVFVEVATDNVNRTVANVRMYFSKYNGSLGKDGCLNSSSIEKVFEIPAEGIDEDELTMELIDVVLRMWKTTVTSSRSTPKWAISEMSKRSYERWKSSRVLRVYSAYQRP